MNKMQTAKEVAEKLLAQGNWINTIPNYQLRMLASAYLEAIQELCKFKGCTQPEEFNPVEWVFEMSSGYPGFRNKRTAEWLHQNDFLSKANK